MDAENLARAKRLLVMLSSTTREALTEREMVERLTQLLGAMVVESERMRADFRWLAGRWEPYAKPSEWRTHVAPWLEAP